MILFFPFTPSVSTAPGGSATTAGTIITGALQLIGVLGSEETPKNAMAMDGLRRLNIMMGTWSLQGLTIPANAREEFALVAGKGGATAYTMGPAGDFDTTRPASVTRAGLVLGQTTPNIELGLPLFTDEGYASVAIKTLTSTQPTGVYFNATYAGGFATVNLWPVPDNAINRLALYFQKPLALFTSLTSSYDLPAGADEPIEYGLAMRLSRVYSVPSETLADVRAIARSSLATYKRSNVRMSDLSQDFTGSLRAGYNILTGQ